MKVKEIGPKIAELEQHGIRVRFFHFRRVRQDQHGPLTIERYYRNGKKNKDRQGHVSPLGGATCCLLETESGEKFCGTAVFERIAPRTLLFPAPLSVPEQEIELKQFCYAIGRAISLGRARKKMDMRSEPIINLSDVRSGMLMRLWLTESEGVFAALETS